MCYRKTSLWFLPRRIQLPKRCRRASVLIVMDLSQKRKSISIKLDRILSKLASWIIGFSLRAIKLTHWSGSKSWSRRLSRVMKAACSSTFKWTYSKSRKLAIWAVASQSFNSKIARRLWNKPSFRAIFITEVWARCHSIIGTLRVIMEAPTLSKQSIWSRSTSRIWSKSISRMSRGLDSRAVQPCRRQYSSWLEQGRQAQASLKSTSHTITRRSKSSFQLFQAVMLARGARYSLS